MSRMRHVLIARQPTPTNDALAAAACGDAAWERMSPDEALENLRAGDVVLGRLDVLPTLDGVEDGLWALGALEARGVHVLNDAPALLGAHDKLLTAWLLRRGGVPHPKTTHVRPGRPFPAVAPPVVVKPRYGSWGRDVRRCDDEAALFATLEEAAHAAWFERHGALVQQLVPPQGFDLRVLVADGEVVGAVNRFAARGEWRTNIALGGFRRPVVELPPQAADLAVAAAEAVGTSLAGVDLLPRGSDWTVLEVNGAVEFTRDYDLGCDVFTATATRLVLAGTEPEEPPSMVPAAAV